MKIVVIFDNFGPYHLARLNAVADVCDLLAVQVHTKSVEYSWASCERQYVNNVGQGAADGMQSKLQMATLLESVTNQSDFRSQLEMRLGRVLDDFQPEAVFVPGWSSKAAFVAQQWCAKQEVPVVGMSESTVWDEKRSAWREAIKRRIVKLCSAALVGGMPQADYLVQLGMPRERVFLGYDAVDNRYFADKVAEVSSRKSQVRTKFGLPENYFLASARFVGKKNLPRLMMAYARYRALVAKSQQSSTPHPDPLPGRGGEGIKKGNTTPTPALNLQPSAVPWSLVLLGDGPLRRELESLISDLGLQSAVSLPGFKQYPDLPVYYGLAGAFIHASTTEQWGLVVNEAMASGLPVLVSNRCGCATDLVREGVNGFTFDPHDTESLAQLMQRVSASGFPLSAFGAESTRIISNWGPERFASGLKAAAECALKVGSKRAGLFDRLLLDFLMRR